MWAISVDQFEIAKLLIKKGANVNYYNKMNGAYSLSYAVSKPDKSMYNYLIKAGANRAVLVKPKQREWWFCDNSYNCIDRMRITFENNSLSPISSVTFMLTLICVLKYKIVFGNLGKIT